MVEAETSHEESIGSHAPALIRFRYRVSCWPNRNPATGRPLVAAEELIAINEAIDRYSLSVKQRSLPSVCPMERYVLASDDNAWLRLPIVLLAQVPFEKIPETKGFKWILEVHNDPFCALVSELLLLEQRWPLIVKSAEELGTTSMDLPQEKDLRRLFFVTLEIVSEEYTLSVLDKLSLFQQPPAPLPQAKVDSAYWEQRRADLLSDLRQMNISVAQYTSAMTRLEREQEVQHTVDIMSDFI